MNSLFFTLSWGAHTFALNRNPSLSKQSQGLLPPLYFLSINAGETENVQQCEHLCCYKTEHFVF